MQKNFMIAVQSENSHLFQRHSNKFNVLKINTQKITLEPRFSQFACLKWIHSVRFKWFQLISQLSFSVYTVFSPFFMITTLRGEKKWFTFKNIDWPRSEIIPRTWCSPSYFKSYQTWDEVLTSRNSLFFFFLNSLFYI